MKPIQQKVISFRSKHQVALISCYTEYFDDFGAVVYAQMEWVVDTPKWLDKVLYNPVWEVRLVNR